MSHVVFKINLEDEEGVSQVRELLGCYLNGSRIKATAERHKKMPYRVDPPAEDTDDEEAVPGVAPPPPPESTIEVDSAGVAWDPTKHSANKSTLKDGTWRPRRGSKPTDDKPVPPPPGGGAGLAPEEATYMDMMNTLKSKGLTMPQMNELAQSIGVQSIALIAAAPELVPAILSLAEKL